jgi:outer membrane protein assembly factor BamB
MRNYDPVFHVAVAGESVYFGSSSTDAVYCLDAGTGEQKWCRTVDGPVRMVPTFAGGKLYFGCDDGHAYCLDAETGSLVWKYRPSQDDRLVANNGKLIPLWPCRTGVLVDAGKAYFGAGLLPWREAYLCAVDAETGSLDGAGLYCKTLNEVTVEGAMLASPSRLYVPQGRSAPMVFNRTDGSHLGNLEGGGGVFAVLTPDAQFAHGPGNKTGWITVSAAETREKIATFSGGNAMVVAEDRAYILKDTELEARDRTSGQEVWSVACSCPYTLILAGDMLLAGGDSEVAAFATGTGKRIASKTVSGRAYGLAVASGRLFVSTDTGMIHCFE